MKFHHYGIPVPDLRPGMAQVPGHQVWATDHQDHPFGLQFMHYGAACDLPALVRERPHLAFEVEDLDRALAGQKVLIQPNSPSEGVRVAFIEQDGEPVELLEFVRPDDSRRA
ncbi:MAG TPA: hypothetical protein VJ486_14025 [Geothrix sp.]|nr:hypothetical protein [Geothrix sp.]